MTTAATHSERETFVLALAKLCPAITPSAVQRLMRLGFTHARLLREHDEKLHRIEAKIISLMHEFEIVAMFYHYLGQYSVVLLAGDQHLAVPTSRKGE